MAATRGIKQQALMSYGDRKEPGNLAENRVYHSFERALFCSLWRSECFLGMVTRQLGKVVMRSIESTFWARGWSGLQEPPYKDKDRKILIVHLAG